MSAQAQPQPSDVSAPIADMLRLYNRLRAEARPADKAALDPGRADVLTKCVLVDDDTAVIRWHRKYGRDHEQGVRTLMLSLTPEGWVVEDDSFRPSPPAPHDKDVRAAKPAPAPAARPPKVVRASTAFQDVPLSPGELPRHMSSSFHVRSIGDKRIIARCDTIDDALRVARALGVDKVELYQYRHDGQNRYDDSVMLPWSAFAFHESALKAVQS